LEKADKMRVNLCGLYTAWIAFALVSSGLAYASGDLRLVEAVQQREKQAVRALLAEHADVNAAQGDGATALHWAVHWDDRETADLLIRAGANVNAANDYGVTALSLACANQNVALVERLLDAGANPNAAQETGETVLMTCARTGTVGGVKALLERGAEANSTDSKRGQTAVMWAAAGKHPEVTRLLIARGADVRLRSKGGFTPLLFAARSGDVGSARMLLEAGADVNEGTPEYGSALVVASAGGHEELGVFLLENGADPNVADKNGITALHNTARNGLEALTGVRYDASYRVRPPNMPLLAKALLARGAKPDARITKNVSRGPDGSPFLMLGSTPFFLAAVSGDANLMRILREGGADARLAASGEITPLMAAARAACTGSCAFQGGNRVDEAEVKKSLEAVTAAVELGADVNAASEDGQTAMHMAAFTGADAVVQYLADHGAKVDVKDKYGETPWSMATGISPVLRYRGLYGNHESTANLLLKLGASQASRDTMDPNAPSPPGQ
jgi:ankyrin repeat protein